MDMIEFLQIHCTRNVDELFGLIQVTIGGAANSWS